MTPDLLSLIMNLRNPLAASMAVDQGRALAAQFLEWVQKLDPELSAALHDPDKVPRPYTISSLQNLPSTNRGLVLLLAGSKTWFRITSLSPQLSLFLVDRLLPSLPKAVQIGDALFELESAVWEAEKHPWAGWLNYNDLIRQELLGKVNRQIKMEFSSPTAFHSNGLHVPFILPCSAIRSWLSCWNSFAPITFPKSLLEGIEESVAVSYYKMQTFPVRYGKATLVGGVGRCTYNILKDDPYFVHIINTLANFAFYSGTGAKTALGMGQTRCLVNSAYRRFKGERHPY